MFLVYILYAMTGIILVGLTRLFLRRDAANLFREPITLTLIGLAIIHSLLPLLKYPLGIYRYGGGYAVGSHLYSIFLVLTFTLVVTGVYSWIRGPRREMHTGQMVLVPMSGLSKLYLGLCVIPPGMLAAVYCYLNVDAAGYENYMRDRITFGGEHTGLPLLIAHWMCSGGLVCYAGYIASQNRHKGLAIVAMVLAIVTFAFFGYTGNRFSVFVVYMAALGVYLLTKWRPGASLLRLMVSKQALLIAGVFAFMVIVGEIRKVMVGMRQAENTFAAVMDTLDGAFGNHDNVLWLVQNDWPFQYGKTYLAGLIVFIPRLLWTDKPTGAGPALVNFMDPGKYEVGKHGISSLTTGLVTESYMNGGFVGVVLVAVVTGIALGILARLRLRCRSPWSLALYCYAAMCLALTMTHGEFLGVWLRLGWDVMPVIAGGLMSKSRAYQVDAGYPQDQEPQVVYQELR